MFAIGSATLQPYTREILREIAKVLNEVPNRISISGHTDAHPYSGGQLGYSNWELSVDRANSSRRALLAAGVTAARVVEVRGYADRHLRVTDDPFDPSNRRISILLPFTDPEINAPAAPPLDIPMVTGME